MFGPSRCTSRPRTCCRGSAGAIATKQPCHQLALARAHSEHVGSVAITSTILPAPNVHQKLTAPPMASAARYDSPLVSGVGRWIYPMAPRTAPPDPHLVEVCDRVDQMLTDQMDADWEHQVEAFAAAPSVTNAGRSLLHRR